MISTAKGRRQLALGIAGCFLLLWAYAGIVLHNTWLVWFSLFAIDFIFLSRVIYFIAKCVLKWTPENQKLLRLLVSRNIVLAVNLINLHLIELNHENRDGKLWLIGFAFMLILIAIWYFFLYSKQKKGPQKSFYAERTNIPSD
jgi:hypothetical protein